MGDTATSTPASPRAGAWRHVRAILLLPGMATVVIPSVLLWRAGLAPAFGLPLPGSVPVLGASAALLALGLWLFVQTVTLFARIGRGTLAPWDPTGRLVVRGVYRHVRNPMISGVCCVLLAETLASGSWALLAWSATFFGLNAIYIPLIEERGLIRRFGDDYRTYRDHVPRWIPRATPWQPDPDTARERGAP